MKPYFQHIAQFAPSQLVLYLEAEAVVLLGGCGTMKSRLCRHCSLQVYDIKRLIKPLLNFNLKVTFIPHSFVYESLHSID
jgi:hypothetical protein